MKKFLRQLKAEQANISLNPAEKIELRAQMTRHMSDTPVRIPEGSRPIQQQWTSPVHSFLSFMNTRTQIVSLAALVLLVGSTVFLYTRNEPTGQPVAPTAATLALNNENAARLSTPGPDERSEAQGAIAQAEDTIHTVRGLVSNSSDVSVLVTLGTADSLLAEAKIAFAAGEYTTATILAHNAIEYAESVDTNAHTSTTVAATPSTNPSNGSNTNTGSSAPATQPTNTPPANPNTGSTSSVAININGIIINQVGGVGNSTATTLLRANADTNIRAASTAYVATKTVVNTNSLTQFVSGSLLARAFGTLGTARAQFVAGDYLSAGANATIALNLANTAKANAEAAMNNVQAGVSIPPSAQPGTVFPTTSTVATSTVTVITLPNTGPTIPLNTSTLNSTTSPVTSTSAHPGTLNLRTIPPPSSNGVQ